MAGRFSVETVFKALDRVSAPVTRMQNRVGKFTRTASRGFHKLNRVASNFARTLKRGFVVGAAAVVSFGFALANVIGIGADFGRAIGSAAAKFPDKIKRGTREFKELEMAARKVGSTTEFTSVQAAQGLNFLAKAGFSAKFSVKALGDIVDFATASEIEFSEAADIASDALGAFGLDSADVGKKMVGLQRVMDVMSKTANSTNTSVAELFESVKNGGPVATAAGVSIETFSATMGFLASNGIKATKAGTAAKNVTLALAGVGNKAAATFKALGISLADSNGDMRDQLDVLDELRGSISKMGSQEKIQVLNAIFGKISLAAATKLLDDASGNVRKLRKELEAAGGSSKKTAAFIRNDVRGSIDGLKSAVEGVKISIFSLNEGPLKDAIDSMTDWVRANEKLIATKIGGFLLSLINNIDGIVTAVKRIGIAIGIFLAFMAVLKTFIGVMTVVNLVMIANPIGLIVAGVAAAIVAFALLITWIEEIDDAFSRMPLILKIAFAPLMWIIKQLRLVKQGVVALGGFLGFGGGEKVEQEVGGGAEAAGAGVVSPQDRVAKNIEESRTINTAEVTIRDETNRAEVTKGKLGTGLLLQQSGVF